MFSGGYHIILIPKKAHQTRRLYLSTFTMHLILGGALLLIPLIVGCFLSVLHYQNKLVALRQEISEEHQVVEQKEVLATRMADIERSVAATDQALAKLSQALDVEMGQVQQGVGPLELGSVDGAPERLSDVTSLAALDLMNDHEGEELFLPKVRGKMSQFESQIADLHSKVEQIADLNKDKIRFLSALPSSMPVAGWITSGFGVRRSPTSGAYRMHYGLDIASPIGTSILAPADGVVMMAEAKSGYGKKVVVDHGYGISTVFAHASKLFVNEGDVVKKGQKIAAVGSTGSSTGPHLHYEVHVDGIPADPLNYVMK